MFRMDGDPNVSGAMTRRLCRNSAKFIANVTMAIFSKKRTSIFDVCRCWIYGSMQMDEVAKRRNRKNDADFYTERL